MSADLDFLNLHDLAGLSNAFIKDTLKAWINQKTPKCLKHPHGFYVMLLKRSDVEQWRLHLWPNGVRQITGMPARIHLHDTHVSSRILTGALTNIQYTSTPVTSDCPSGKPVYEVIYDGNRYAQKTANTLRKSEVREAVSETDRLNLEVGDFYCIERYTLHGALVPTDVATCTLVCMHEHADGIVKLMGVDGYPDEISFLRTDHDGSVFLEYL